MKLSNRVAIVTGSASGIGKAIAKKFASEAASVVVCDVNIEGAEHVANAIKNQGGKAIAIKVDVSKKVDVQSLVNRTLDNFGAVHILVNNAGIGGNTSLLELTEEQWDTILAVDLKSVFLCTQAVLGHMIKQQYGKIVNISSVHGLGTPGTFQVHYGAAKAGVIQLTRDTARIGGPHGINVNSIAPGLIITAMQERLPREQREEGLENRKRVSLLGRAGEPEDVANLALFLVSDDSGFITGQTIRCDGGRTDLL